MPAHKSGFTLIELLVSIGIMVVILGTGTVVFSSFNQRNQTELVARQVQNYFKLGVSYARNKNIPAACTGFTGYKVVFSSGTTAQISADCDVDVSPSSLMLSLGSNFAVSVNADSTFAFAFSSQFENAQFSNDAISFTPIVAGVPIEVQVTGPGSNVYSFEVSSTGTVTDPVKE